MKVSQAWLLTLGGLGGGSYVFIESLKKPAESTDRYTYVAGAIALMIAGTYGAMQLTGVYLR